MRKAVLLSIAVAALGAALGAAGVSAAQANDWAPSYGAGPYNGPHGYGYAYAPDDYRYAAPDTIYAEPAWDNGWTGCRMVQQFNNSRPNEACE